MTTAAWLTDRLRAHRTSLALVVGAGLSAATLAAVSAHVIGAALDEALRAGRHPAALLLAAAVLLTVQMLRAAALLVRQRAAIRAGTRLERDLRRDLLMRTLTHADPSRTHGLVPTLISDVRAVRLLISPGLDLGIMVSAFVVVVLVTPLLLSPQLVLAPLVFAVGFAVVAFTMVRAITRSAGHARDRSAGLTDQVAEALEHIEAVRDTGGHEVRLRLERAVREHRDAVVRQGRQESRTPLFLLLGLVQAVGFAHSLVLVRSGALSVGELVAYHNLLLMLGAPTFGSGPAFSAIAGGLAAAGRIRSALPGGSVAEPVAGTGVRLRDVVPEPGRGLPERVDLELPPCSLAVVTGPTGSGKSTLLRLMAGTERPLSGSVTTGNAVLVADHDVLFSMSLEENTRLGRPSADLAEARAAGKRAGVAEFAETLPQGWATRLGARGSQLSGGQRQRVALARALLSDAGAILLDDPFSALDAQLARVLATELIDEARSRTVVIVSDRSDLLAAATHLVCLGDAGLTVTPGGG